MITKDGNEQNVEHVFEHIVFSDFENSEIVTNRKRLMEFIKILSKEVDTGETEWHYPSERSLRVQEKYMRGGYTTQDYYSLYDRKYPIYINRLKLTTSNLIFQSTDSKGTTDFAIVPDKELQHTFARRDYKYDQYDYNRDRNLYRTGCGGPDFDVVYEEIRTLILEKANYDIYHEEKDKYKERERYLTYYRVTKYWD